MDYQAKPHTKLPNSNTSCYTWWHVNLKVYSISRILHSILHLINIPHNFHPHVKPKTPLHLQSALGHVVYTMLPLWSSEGVNSPSIDHSWHYIDIMVGWNQWFKFCQNASLCTISSWWWHNLYFIGCCIRTTDIDRRSQNLRHLYPDKGSNWGSGAYVLRSEHEDKHAWTAHSAQRSWVHFVCRFCFRMGSWQKLEHSQMELHGWRRHYTRDGIGVLGSPFCICD